MRRLPLLLIIALGFLPGCALISLVLGFGGPSVSTAQLALVESRVLRVDFLGTTALPNTLYVCSTAGDVDGGASCVDKAYFDAELARQK